MSPGLEIQAFFKIFSDFIIVSLRIGGFLAAAPFFGAQAIPKSVLVIFTVSISIFLLGYIKVPTIYNIQSNDAIIFVFSEIFLGAVVGLFLSIIFAAVALAGEKIASSGGLSFAAQIDPTTGGQTPVVSQVLTLFLMVIFLSVDGHLIILQLIINSYVALPIGYTLNLTEIVQTGILSADIMFTMAATIMLPAVIVLTFVNTIIGIITRSAPQLNLFSFGFPIILISLFFILYLTVHTNASVFMSLIDQSTQKLQQILGQ